VRLRQFQIERLQRFEIRRLGKAVLDRSSGSRAQPAPEIDRSECRNSLRQRDLVSGRHQKAVVARRDDLRHTTHRGRDTRPARIHRFEQRQRQAFDEGRKDEYVDGAEHIGWMRDVAEKKYVCTDTELLAQQLEALAIGTFTRDN